MPLSILLSLRKRDWRWQYDFTTLSAERADTRLLLTPR